MFVQLFLPVLISLLSLSASAPTTDNCTQLTQTVTVNQLNQILGRWILIEGVSNNAFTDSVLETVESMWMTLNTTADNNTLLFDQASQNSRNPSFYPPGVIEHLPKCTRSSQHLTIINNQTLEFSLNFLGRVGLPPYYRFLQPCPACLLMHTYTNNSEMDYQSLYLLGRDTTLEESNLEKLRKQAECMQFPLPAKFQYNPNNGLCPM